MHWVSYSTSQPTAFCKGHLQGSGVWHCTPAGPVCKSRFKTFQLHDIWGLWLGGPKIHDRGTFSNHAFLGRIYLSIFFEGLFVGYAWELGSSVLFLVASMVHQSQVQSSDTLDRKRTSSMSTSGLSGSLACLLWWVLLGPLVLRPSRPGDRPRVASKGRSRSGGTGRAPGRLPATQGVPESVRTTKPWALRPNEGQSPYIVLGASQTPRELPTFK